MKTFISIVIFFLFLSLSCQQEEILSHKPVQLGNEDPGVGVGQETSILNVVIHYPASNAYDSAYITFKNPDGEITEKLALDIVNSVALKTITGINQGKWNVSISFFSTIKSLYESLEQNAKFTIDIGSTTTDLISTNDLVSIKEKNGTLHKTIRWNEFFYYQLFVHSDTATPQGFVRLPRDPTNPFVEIRTFEQKWIYAYVDRSFYNSSPDGANNHFVGGGAFEIYGQYGESYDRLASDIIDSTSLNASIAQVANQKWTLADCIVVIVGSATDQELLTYHVWDFRATNGLKKITGN